MKISAKLLALLMLFGMPLAACNTGNNSDKPKDPDTDDRDDIDDDDDAGKDDDDAGKDDDDDAGKDDDDDDEGGGGSGGGTAQHKGTQSDPYTVSDAYIVWSGLKAREATGAVYVKGTVTGSVTQNGDKKRVRFYLEGSPKNLYVCDAFASGKTALSASALKAGDEVLVTGSLKAYETDQEVLFEVCYDKNKNANCEVLTINGKATGSGGGGSDEGGGGGSGEGGGGGTVDPITGDVVFDYSTISSISGTSNGVTYKAEKAGAQNDPVVNTTSHDLRIYANGKLTVSASSNMTQIDFAISAQGKKRQAEISCSTGKMTYDLSNSLVSWSGNASSVVFTVGSSATYGTESSKAGQFCFTSMAIALGEGGGGGSGEGGGGGGQTVDDGEAFFKEVLEVVFGYEPVFDEDYWDDDGLFTILECEDLTADIDDLYSDLSVLYSCTEPEDDEGLYGFYLDSDDGNYYIDIYSGEDETEGNYIEMDLWEFEE